MNDLIVQEEKPLDKRLERIEKFLLKMRDEHSIIMHNIERISRVLSRFELMKSIENVSPGDETIIRYDTINGVIVETSAIFETDVCGGKNHYANDCIKYSTLKEAIKGHAEIVERERGGL